MRSVLRKALVGCLLVLVIAFPLLLIHRAQGAPQEAAGAAAPAYLNPSLPIPERVNDLVQRMTLQEKVLQMQHTAPAIPRLGIPAYDWWNEALHGVARSGYATVFPQAIGVASTWDAPLLYNEASVISDEARAKYNQALREGIHSIYFGLTFWSPNINIFRDPRWGRGQETYGEDPYLTATMAEAFVRGMQGNDPRYLEVVSTPKHFAVHSGPDPLRHRFNVNVSPYDLEDTYLPAFRAAIVGAGADSVMCAYNAVDGVPDCANAYLLNTTLRQAWHFHGYVTSDCGAVADIAKGHHYAPDIEHASALAVIAGTDTTCGDEYVTLVKAVHDGLISESKINQAVRRLFTARMRLGMFDPPSMVPFNRIPYSDDDSPAHRRLALRVARESMVLLKNDGVLPLQPSVKTIAVVGPNAESLGAIQGNYHGTPRHPVLPLAGMLREFAGKARVRYAQGSAHDGLYPIPVPRTAFRPAVPDREAGLGGLTAEYFANPNFSGQPVLRRTDPQIQFNWEAASPARGVPLQGFSVRWRGTFTPPGPGEYTFSIHTSGCYPCGDQELYRLYLDGKLVLSSPKPYLPGKPSPRYRVRWNNAKPHAFRFDYAHETGLFGAGIMLDWEPPAAALRAEAVEAAKRSDVVVAFLGLSPHLVGEEMPLDIPGFDHGDRTKIALPAVQRKLLEALVATGKPLVVVLMNGEALAVNWAEKHAAAILEAWYPGEEAGTAIAETLAGENNPGGKLPITFYASLSQLPPFTDYSMRNRTYRYFRGRPLFPFGYGLSYSTFAFGPLQLSSARVKAGETLSVQTSIRNTSQVPGDEVAELYIEYPPSRLAPFRALKGFARVHLGPGETKPVNFSLDPRDLSEVNRKGDRMVLPGAYTIFVGGGQPGTGAPGSETHFEIVGRESLPR